MRRIDLSTIGSGTLHSRKAAAVLEDGALEEVRARRYAYWDGDLGRRIMGGTESLASLHERGAGAAEPTRHSGGQEALENLVARYIDTVE